MLPLNGLRPRFSLPTERIWASSADHAFPPVAASTRLGRNSRSASDRTSVPPTARMALWVLFARHFSIASATSFVIDPFPSWFDVPTPRPRHCHDGVAEPDDEPVGG